jgi:hypothetical protein
MISSTFCGVVGLRDAAAFATVTVATKAASAVHCVGSFGPSHISLLFVFRDPAQHPKLQVEVVAWRRFHSILEFNMVSTPHPASQPIYSSPAGEWLLVNEHHTCR